MIGQLFNHRYRIEAELGKGGMGIVYRGHDTLLDREVAVKVLSTTGIGTEGRARLLHEARAAARLNHPNIVSIFDAGEVEGHSFIIMELLKGESLYEHRPQTIEEIILIARQVCAALEHAHAQGIVHRDLKPENIIVDATGKVKLTDFGLARSVTSRISTEGSFIGTIFYMAPEQALGRPVDGRADLYALGAMLYELTTGRLPFNADDPLAIISQHLYAPVVPPSTYNPKLPTALDVLILRLLSKQPEERPASAAEVGQALDPEHLNLSIPHVQPSTIDQLARGRLVGRERELAEAKTLWRQATAGAAEMPVLLISGESGVGKTPLVREIKALAEVSGAKVLSSECYAEGSAPYAPIAEIIRQALPLVQSQVPDNILIDLITLAPDLQIHLPLAQPDTHLDSTGEQNRLSESLAAFCSLLALQHPVLLVVEDVHWADGSSLALLRHLARRSRAARLKLLIIMTYRDIELDEACCLQDILLDLNRERLSARLKLTRFDRQQTRQLLNMMFQEEVSDGFLEAIYRETEGNQFFIEEVCKALIEQNKIYRQAGHWQVASLESVQLPQSVRMTIQSRVSKLPEAVQDVLRLAAIVGREFDFATLSRASDFDEETLIEALETAEQAQLISELHASEQARGRSNGNSERFSFAHALIAAALRESVSGLRRHRLHRRVATAIEMLHPDDYDLLAYHYAQANDAAQAYGYYLRAGNRALTVYANNESERHYRAALEMTDKDADRASLLAQLGEAVFRQSRYTEALNIWLEAIALFKTDSDHNRVARLYARAGRAAWYASDPPRGLALCREGLAAIPETLESPGMAALLHETARAYRFNDQHEAALPWCQKALSMSEKLGLVEIQAETLATLGILENQPPEARREALLKAVDLSESAGLLATASRAHLNLGGHLHHFGEPAAARQHYSRAYELAQQMGIISGSHDYLVAVIEADFQLGNLAAAKESLNTLHQISALLPNPGNALLYEQLAQVRLLRFQGDLEQAAAQIKSWQTEDFPDYIKYGLHTLMADIYYATGQLNAAAEALDMALRMEETSKVDDRVYPRLLSLSIHAQRGNLPQARKALAEMSDLVDDHKKANVGLLHWAEARLACFEARWEEAAAKYQMGIDIARQIGMSWFATYVQMELGEALLSRVSAQDQAAGREHLQQALESFKLIQAMGYVAQLQSRLQETDIIASGSR